MTAKTTDNLVTAAWAIPPSTGGDLHNSRVWLHLDNDTDPAGELISLPYDEIERMDIRVGDTLAAPFLRRVNPNGTTCSQGFMVKLTERGPNATKVTDCTATLDQLQDAWATQFAVTAMETIIPSSDFQFLKSLGNLVYSPQANPMVCATDVATALHDITQSHQ